jgi:hypothetical protein
MGSEFTFGESEAQAWRGVVLALDQTACGRAAYCVKLWGGKDAASLVCVLETFDGHEAIGEWTRQSLRFGLSKFIEKAPGEIEGAELRLAQAQACQTPTWRRRGAALANRRPRSFLRRGAQLTPWQRQACDGGFSPAIPAS